MYSPLLLKQAQDAVNALPDGDDKELLQARIDQVVQAQEVAKVQKQVENATKAVERAESTKVKVSDQNMYRQAGNSIAVNVLMEIMKQILETGVFINDRK